MLRALVRPAATAAAMFAALLQVKSEATVSSMEHWSGIRVVGEWKLVDERRVL
jgi:NaMN:DMB phosphoribosyltransferase